MVDRVRNRSVKMGTQLEGLIKENIEEFLKANTGVMAYNTTKILGVDLNTMVHHLNIREDCKPVKQKKHLLAPDK